MDNRILTTIDYIKLENIPATLNIASSELGSDYLTETDFLETLNTDDSFCMLSTHNGVVSGFSICKIFGPEKIDEMLALPDCDEKSILMKFKTIGLIDSVAVAHEMKGKGIGGELLDACYKELVSRGAKVICAMAWKGVNGITNIEGILVRLGMLPHVEIKGYWNRFVPSPEGHACPICGRPCKCSAVLYLKKSS
jgi:Predicted acetyltransferase